MSWTAHTVLARPFSFSKQLHRWKKIASAFWGSRKDPRIIEPPTMHRTIRESHCIGIICIPRRLTLPRMLYFLVTIAARSDSKLQNFKTRARGALVRRWWDRLIIVDTSTDLLIGGIDSKSGPYCHFELYRIERTVQSKSLFQRAWEGSIEKAFERTSDHKENRSSASKFLIHRQQHHFTKSRL